METVADHTDCGGAGRVCRCIWRWTGWKYQFLYCLSCSVYDTDGELYTIRKCSVATAYGTGKFYESIVSGLFYDSNCFNRGCNGSCVL